MIEYSIDTSLQLLQIRASDPISLLDLANFSSRVQRDRQYRPTFNALFIIETNTLLAKIGVRSLATFFQRFEEPSGSAAWAFVMPDDSQKSKLSEALQNLVPKRFKLRVFDDEFPALQWLTECAKTQRLNDTGSAVEK